MCPGPQKRLANAKSGMFRRLARARGTGRGVALRSMGSAQLSPNSNDRRNEWQDTEGHHVRRSQALCGAVNTAPCVQEGAEKGEGSRAENKPSLLDFPRLVARVRSFPGRGLANDWLSGSTAVESTTTGTRSWVPMHLRDSHPEAGSAAGPALMYEVTCVRGS